MLKYQIIYWRDIPVQVRMRDGRSRTTRPLSPRFQETVHRAAYRARAINGFDYIEQWRTSAWQERDATAKNVIVTIVTGLENEYNDERLNKLARNKGYEPHDY